jgi:hypothetical protein
MGSPTTSAASLTAPASGTLVVGPTKLNGVVVGPGSVLTIYDNTAVSGKVILQFQNVGSSTNTVVFRNAVRADIGLSYNLTGASALIYYGAT